MSFQMKRGHLSAVRFGRSILRGGNDEVAATVMTPARFDVLYVVHQHSPACFGPHRRSIEQRHIWKLLGLSGSTISKMISRLVELGLLTRDAMRGRDRRTRMISLTPEGTRCIRHAFQVVFGDRTLAELYESLIRDQGRAKRRHEVSAALGTRIDDVQAFASKLGDTSSEVYRLRSWPQPDLPARSRPRPRRGRGKPWGRLILRPSILARRIDLEGECECEPAKAHAERCEHAWRRVPARRDTACLALETDAPCMKNIGPSITCGVPEGDGEVRAARRDFLRQWLCFKRKRKPRRWDRPRPGHP
jgi:DNA-binding MarR family transcriptional regulator